MSVVYCTVAIATILIILLKLFTLKPRKICDVYTQPTILFYFKVFFMYTLLRIRRLKTKDEGTAAGYGIKSKPKIVDMECPQPLSDHPKAIDAVYFNGANERGCYIVMATARRPEGVINGILYIKLAGIGILQLPRMPDTLLFGDGKGFGAEGMQIVPLEPMKSWKLDYKGKMKLHTDFSKSFDVVVDLTWSSSLPYFDFDTDMHPWALSKSLARESWSRQYFDDLKTAHQTHYEHMGTLEGKIIVDGQEYEIKLDSLRDHSYGHKREWKLIHRYGLHMLHTEDGFRLNVGIVSQPITSSSLELGYVNTPEGGKISVSEVDLPLWQHGEKGTPPTDYAFSFVAGGKRFFVEVNVVDSPVFYMGWDWETRIVERFVTCKVNGRPGWGIAEWAYRNKLDQRPQEYLQKDPQWTKTLNKG